MVILNNGKTYGFLKFKFDKIIDTIFGNSNNGYTGSEGFCAKLIDGVLKIVEKEKEGDNENTQAACLIK